LCVPLGDTISLNPETAQNCAHCVQNAFIKKERLRCTQKAVEVVVFHCLGAITLIINCSHLVLPGTLHRITALEDAMGI